MLAGVCVCDFVVVVLWLYARCLCGYAVSRCFVRSMCMPLFSLSDCQTASQEVRGLT